MEPLGAWFAWSTNEWLAVQYGDGSFPEWSMAIARDSDGNHFRSTERFGGALASYLFKRLKYDRVKDERYTSSYASNTDSYRKQIDMVIEQSNPANVPAMKRFHDITTSTNLAAGRVALEALGFEPFKP